MVLKKCLLLLCLMVSIFATENKIGMYEKQGKYLPLDTTFVNAYNQTVTLKEAINNKPTILTLNYFDCPSLCSPLLNAVADVLNKLQLDPYLEYNVITISIHDKDNATSAKTKKESILSTITRPFPPQTWSFLTTNQENITTITQAVGFNYEKRIKDGVVDYLHPAAIIVLSPEGKISRYLNGIQYLPFDLKLALLEANEGKIRPTITKTLLYCFAYDAKSKTYVFQAEKVVGSFMFGIVLLFFIYLVKTGRNPRKDGQDE